MFSNLSNYIESLLDPNGRFRTLENIYALTDEFREPRMSMTTRSVNFAVRYDGNDYTLKCLDPAADTTNLREISDFTRLIDTPYLTEYRFCPSEMLVFNNDGSYQYVDVVLQRQPCGERLDTFLAHHVSNGNIAPITEVLRHLDTLTGWLLENEFAHQRIKISNIIITPGNTPVLINYESARRIRSTSDGVILGCIAIVLFIAACEPELYLCLRNRSMSLGQFQRLLPMLARLLEDELAPLRTLAIALKEATYAPDYSLCRKIGALADCEIRPYESLSHITDLMTHRTDLPQTQPQTNKRRKEESKYDRVGRMDDMLRPVCSGGWWSYVDQERNVVIEDDFTFAYSFREGRAVVEKVSGFGLIDLAGRYIIEPECDDIEWNDDLNVAIVSVNGKSGLYSRDGEALTGLIYDQILSPSDGLFTARKGDRYGFIRRDGSIALDFVYDDAFGFKAGYARVRQAERDFLIDLYGNCVLELHDDKNEADNSLEVARHFPQKIEV